MVKQVFMLFLLSLAWARIRADLPANVTKCKISDTQFNNCIKEQAIKVYQNLYEGVEELGIPVIKPVKLSRILLTPNNEFQFDLRNCKGREINKVKITDVKMDIKFQTLDIKFLLPNPSLDCTYRANGKYLNRVYMDRGFINITFGNVVGYYSTDYDSMVINNSSYYQVKNDVFRFDSDKITIKLSHEDGSDDIQGYSAAALLAIVFCIPFALRVLIHKEVGKWNNFPQAFYHAHLELFLGNGCLGVGVMMLLALTVERYVSVCHPSYSRPLMGPPHVTVALIPLATFLLYLPSVFRGEITHCLLGPQGPLIYQKRDNHRFLHSIFYSVYKVVVEVVFKVAPTILLAGFNLRIMIVYRRTCDRRRKMTLSRKASSDEDPRKYAEERRLVLLLGSTSILFLVCVSPMVILNVTLSEDNLTLYPYQVFRALANLLEITNYSITFYIYCLFSEDFRSTLLRTLQCPWRGRAPPPSKPPAHTTVTATGTPPTHNLPRSSV